MIEFHRVSKKFQNNFWEKEFYGLKDASFEIRAGSMTGFLGANGAGKTTAIKMLMKFSSVSSGSIEYKGLGNSDEVILSQMGYLPERAYLYQHLTGCEFLEYVGSISSLTGQDLKHQIHHWSKQLKLDHALYRQIRGYSKGMQQRLGFIACVIHRPKLLILDEPLSGLDPIGRREFKEIFWKLNKEEGTTIFFSSHVVSDVQEICDDVIFLEKGHLSYAGKISELLEKHQENKFVITYQPKGQGERLILEVSGADKTAALKNLIESSAEIIDIRNTEKSLEEIFYKVKNEKH